MSFNDILNKPYRWPKKGDRLLRDSSNWDRGADFPNDEISRQAYIWLGYRRAAEILIDASAANFGERRILIYPILFNYRHALETAMKWIIDRYGRYSTTPVGSMEHHNLWELWKVCRQIIRDVGSDDVAIVDVEQVIKDFHDLDKTALTFRYATDINGATLEVPTSLIDVEHLRDVMDATLNFFDGADGELDANSSAAP